jgi:hypothetical protein
MYSIMEQDHILKERCEEFTKKMLEDGMEIDRICLFVKDYQNKYMYLKNQKCGDKLTKAYTFKYWWQSSRTEDGNLMIM